MLLSTYKSNSKSITQLLSLPLVVATSQQPLEHFKHPTGHKHIQTISIVSGSFGFPMPVRWLKSLVR